MMRWIVLALVALLVVVQADLWLGRRGVRVVGELQRELDAQAADNAAKRERNARAAAEVRDLKEGLEMVEDKARGELGMIKPDEVYVQVAPPASAPR